MLQGCFKIALNALRTANGGDASLLYAVSFNYAVGLERLLKVILLLDCWNCDGKFPSDEELKRHGHDVRILFDSVRKLRPKYKIEHDERLEPDALDWKILNFLAEFAKSSRYFNLCTLGGSSRTVDPLAKWVQLIDEIYLKDIPSGRRVTNEAEVVAFVSAIKGYVTSMSSTSLDGEPQSYVESSQEHERMVIVLPEICWRLVKMLVPLKALLVAIRRTAHEKDGSLDEETSIPFMEEFLDFVCKDKEIVLKSSDWP